MDVSTYTSMIRTIQEYADECLFEPSLRWSRHDFQIRSYSRWAVNELIDRLIEEADLYPFYIFEREHKEPLDVIREFVDDMDGYCELSEDNNDSRLIFSVAREVGEDILYLFL